MENTGERILIEKESPMFIARHICAYRFASSYSNGKTVLDLGCGEFGGLFRDYFEEVRLFGLKRSLKHRVYRRLKKSGLFDFFPVFCDPVKGFYSRIDCGNFQVAEEGLESALDFYAVCS